MDKKNRYIKINPLQSIQLYGLWNQPRELLGFDHIRKNNYTWNFLRNNIGISAEQLAKLQPDKHLWISFSRITLHDVMDMTVFPVNPITDLCADLGELWSMQWQATDYHKMDVKYHHFINAGMTPEIMKYFNFTLSDWMKLGFTQTDISPSSELIFGISQEELKELVLQFDERLKTDA